MDKNKRAKETSLAILDEVFANYPARDFAVRLWDGTTWPERDGPSPAFTLVLNHPGALRKMFLPPSELNLGEAYIYGDFDVEGDLIAAIPMAEYLQSLDLGLGDQLKLARCHRAARRTAGRRGQRRASLQGAGSSGDLLPLRRLQRLLCPVAG